MAAASTRGRNSFAARTHQAGALIESLVRKPASVVGAILIATLVLYLPTTNDWFQTDDFLLLSGAQDLRFPTYVREAFDFRDFEPLRLYTYRPLHFVTMDALHSAFGLNAASYHALSISIHLGNVVLVWLLARRLTGSDAVAHGTAAIFALHPVYTQTVGWVAANNSLIATTGQLIAFLGLLQFVETGSKRWYAVSILAYTAALLIHQEMFLLPAVFGVYLLLRQSGDLRGALRPVITSLLPYGLILSVFLGIQRWNTQESVINDHFVLDAHTLKNHVGLVAMSAFPSHLSGMQAVHVVAAVLFGVAVLIGLLLARERRKLIVLGIVWYHAALLLSELYFVDTPAIPFLARKLYPAGPALALVIALVGESYWNALKPRLAPAAPYLLVLVGITLALAFVRAGETRDRLEPIAERSQLFVNDLRAEYPELSSGDTLYLAAAPFSCTVLICYPRDVVSLYYDDVRVVVISPARARDPAFLTALGPYEHVLCWRCPAGGPEP